MKTLITLVLAAVLLAPMAFAAPEEGQGPRGPRGEFGPGMGEGNFAQMLLGRMGEELGLSAEQKAGIKQVMEESKAAVQENREAVRQAMQNLNEAAESGDEAAITAAGKAAGDALTTQAILRAKTSKKINALLTEEQRAKLEEMKANMKERFQERREQGETPRQGRGQRDGEGRGPREGRGPKPEGV